MAKLVVLQDKREKLTEGQDRVVSQLEGLLKKARAGKIRGMVYATVAEEDASIMLGMLNTDTCGVHELVGLSQMLNDRLLTAVREIQD
jgi:hypothetical protein